MHFGPVPVTWVAEHRGHIPGRQFKDIQVEGPFARWEHTHRFEPVDPGGCLLEDRIEYELPADPLSSFVCGRTVADRLKRVFEYRHRVTARDLALLDEIDLGGSRTFAVSGASGLVGSALRAVLSTAGHRSVSLVRASAGSSGSVDGISWDPSSGSIDAESLEGADTMVHLAGESIASGRWSAERRRVDS